MKDPSRKMVGETIVFNENSMRRMRLLINAALYSDLIIANLIITDLFTRCNTEVADELTVSSRLNIIHIKLKALLALSADQATSQRCAT